MFLFLKVHDLERRNLQKIYFQVFSIAGAQAIAILFDTLKSRVQDLSLETILKEIFFLGVWGGVVIFGDYILRIKILRFIIISMKYQ